MYSQGDSRILDEWARFINSRALVFDRENRPGLDPHDLGNLLNDANCISSVRTAVLEKLARSLDIPWKSSDDPWRMITDDRLKPYLPPAYR